MMMEAKAKATVIQYGLGCINDALFCDIFYEELLSRLRQPVL
jgi:hypothetical protein